MRCCLAVCGIFLALCGADDHRTQADADRLLNWARKQGLSAPIQLVKRENGFKMLATRDIPPSEAFVHAPTRLCITPQLATAIFGEVSTTPPPHRHHTFPNPTTAWPGY